MLRSDLLALVTQALVAVVVVVCSTVLGVRDVLDAQAVVAVFTAVIALYGTASIATARAVRENGQRAHSQDGTT